jgi:hypothetical protein
MSVIVLAKPLFGLAVTAANTNMPKPRAIPELLCFCAAPTCFRIPQDLLVWSHAKFVPSSVLQTVTRKTESVGSESVKNSDTAAEPEGIAMRTAYPV